MRQVLALILCLIGAISSEAAISYGQESGSQNFCQELEVQKSVAESSANLPFVLSRFNEALERADFPRIEVLSCRLKNVETHLFVFKKYNFSYVLSYDEEAVHKKCVDQSMALPLIEVDMRGLIQLESSTNEKAYRLIFDLAQSMGFEVIESDVVGYGYYFNSVTLRYKNNCKN